MKIKFYLAIALLALSSTSIASGWTPDLTVERAFTQGTSDLVIIYTSGGSEYTTGCTQNNWSFNADTDSRRNRAYSTVMTALVSSKKNKIMVHMIHVGHGLFIRQQQ